MTALDKRAEALIHRMTAEDDTLHVAYDALAAFVDGTATREARRAVLAHISRCTECADDVRDLRETAERVEPQHRPLWLWAAAAVFVIGISAFLVFHKAAKQPSSTPALGIRDTADLALLDHHDAAAVRAALDHGKLDVAPAAAALRERQGKLMGKRAEAAFEVLTPVATYVRDTKPRFAWKPLVGRRRYRLEVYDHAQKRVLLSEEITGTSWTADRDLARGNEYIWQVVAEDHTLAPSPPYPPARFGVLSAEAVARLDATATRYPGSHLLLAIAEAREGALDDARLELAELQRLNPRSVAVARLARSLGTQ